jgi:DNA-binding transcriptional LysR family regulator
VNRNDLDFRALTVFRALFQTHRVTAAADQLGLGQSNVSRELAKLRKHFGDPLFVRTRNGMEATPRAIQIAKSVDEMLHLYEYTLQGAVKFDPQESHRTFHIAGSEVGHVLLFSRISERVHSLAPNVKLHAVPLGVNTLAKELEGDTDMAIGPFPKLFAGIHERNIFWDRYVCLVSTEHPVIDGSISIAQFKTSHHILWSARNVGHVQEKISSELMRTIPKENIRLITENFLTAALLCRQSNYIATLPAGVAEILGDLAAFQILDPPIELPPFDVKLYWHERYHSDPAHKWLRNIIYEEFQKS